MDKKEDKIEDKPNYNEVKNSWENEATEFNRFWSIDNYIEKDNTLEAQGIINSPTADFYFPYPIHSWNFTLKWDGKFSMQIDITAKYIDKDTPNLNKLFGKVQETVYFKPDHNVNNVHDFLDLVYEALYPRDKVSFIPSAKNEDKVLHFGEEWSKLLRNYSDDIDSEEKKKKEEEKNKQKQDN